MLVGTYAQEDCGLLNVCGYILVFGIGEVLIEEKAWAHFNQECSDIHACFQWVPHKSYKGVKESRLPQASWGGISNAGSFVIEVNPGNSLTLLRQVKG